MNEIKTAGFDAVIVINERLINEACAALFYSNFLTFNGSVDFSEGEHALPTDVLSRVPVTLKKCLKVDYRCKLLHEPYLDFRNDGKVSVHAHLRLYVWMLDGLEIRFDADLSLLVPLNFKPMINSDNTLLLSGETTYLGSKLCSTSIPSSLTGRSTVCQNDAFTS